MLWRWLVRRYRVERALWDCYWRAGKRGDWTSYEYCERHSWAVRIYWRLVYYVGSFLLVMLLGMAIDGFLTFMDRLRDLLWM